jgi:uncharacterized hydrophobic protein (TIGR00271 family)
MPAMDVEGSPADAGLAEGAPPSAKRSPGAAFPQNIPWWRLRSVSDLRRSARLTPGFLLLTVLSSSIATFGLVTDSAAVIIGAMLIAPLLSPIMAIALAVLGGRRPLLERAIVTLAVGTGLALAVSFALAWIALQLPFDALTTIPAEVASRTHPSPFDLAIALAGGAAAAYALVRLEGAAALFGVAIATALLPPLCTVGIGLALGDPGVSTAAGILFVTNLVAIAASATMVFTALHLRPRRSRAGHSGLFLVTGLVVAIAFVLVPTAIGVAQQNTATTRSLQFADTVSSTVADVLAARLPGSTLVGVERTRQGTTLDLRVTAQVTNLPSLVEVGAMQAEIATRLGAAVHMVLVAQPVVELDPLASQPPSPASSPTPTPAPTPASTPQPAPTPTPAPTSTQRPSPPNTST